MPVTHAELADSLAKQGAAMAPTETGQIVPVTKNHFTTLINDEIDRRWNHRWTKQTPIARQSKLLWPKIDNLRSRQILLCKNMETWSV